MVFILCNTKKKNFLFNFINSVQISFWKLIASRTLWFRFNLPRPTEPFKRQNSLPTLVHFPFIWVNRNVKPMTTDGLISSYCYTSFARHFYGSIQLVDFRFCPVNTRVSLSNSKSSTSINWLIIMSSMFTRVTSIYVLDRLSDRPKLINLKKKVSWV